MSRIQRISDVVFGSVLRVLGENVVYERISDNTKKDILCTFSKETRVDEAGGHSSYLIQQPSVFIKKSLLGFKPCEGDRIHRNNSTYEILEIYPDELGDYMIILDIISEGDE